MTAKQRNGSKDPLFPLTIALNGLAPLNKVWVNYETDPKNRFNLKINDFDYYTLVREDLDFDPT